MEKKIFDIQERIQTEKKRRRTLGDVNYLICREKENRDWKGEKSLGKGKWKMSKWTHKHTGGIVKFSGKKTAQALASLLCLFLLHNSSG